jgi:hypothetical protein
MQDSVVRLRTERRWRADRLGDLLRVPFDGVFSASIVVDADDRYSLS